MVQCLLLKYLLLVQIESPVHRHRGVHLVMHRMRCVRLWPVRRGILPRFRNHLGLWLSRNLLCARRLPLALWQHGRM